MASHMRLVRARIQGKLIWGYLFDYVSYHIMSCFADLFDNALDLIARCIINHFMRNLITCSQYETLR